LPAFLPQLRPDGKGDVSTLRWSVRSDGRAGFVFVNNHQRLLVLPPKQDVQFEVTSPGGAMTFPSPPVTVPPGSRFLWPFNFALGHGIQLDWATAQPVCLIDEANVRTVFFAETKGIPAGFAFAGDTDIEALSGTVARTAGQTLVRGVEAGRSVAIQASGSTGARVRVVLLSETDSLALWKGAWHGRERVFLTQAGLVLDGGALRLTCTNRMQLSVGLFPGIDRVADGQGSVRGKGDGVFQRYQPRTPRKRAYTARISQRQQAGPARRVPMGKGSRPVAAQPEDADFEAAAIWKIKLPSNIRMETDPLLRLHYVGDVARVLLNGQLVTDDFYNGRVLEIGLRRHTPAILNGDLTVSILPLRRDAPIHLAEEARPEFGEAESVMALERVEIVPRYSVELTAP